MQSRNSHQAGVRGGKGGGGYENGPPFTRRFRRHVVSNMS